jgi:hypothetical protein
MQRAVADADEREHHRDLNADSEDAQAGSHRSLA